MPGGRPTAYNEDRCAEIIEWMRQGYSIAGYAGSVGVSRQTVYQWAEDHPEFSDALNEARSSSAAWWESQAIKIAGGQEGSGAPAMVIFGLKNRVSDEWREKVHTEHTGAGGGPIKTEEVSPRDRIASKLARLSTGSGTDSDTGGAD